MVDHPNHLALLGALLAAAAAWDVAERRVPNALAALVGATGVGAQWARGGPGAAALGVAAGACLLVPLLLAWAGGKLGGGDAKLAAAAAVWLGFPGVVAFAIYTAVAGGPLALLVRASHQLALARTPRRAGPAACEVAGPQTVPYAVAIAAGAVATLTWGMP